MNIIQRLNIFMESTGLSVSQFADKLAIPRPSMSQMLNGRNKKVSNEILEKLHAVFPALNVSWLLFGEGDMESAENTQFSSPQKTLNFADDGPQTSSDQQIANSAASLSDLTDNSSSTNSTLPGGQNSVGTPVSVASSTSATPTTPASAATPTTAPSAATNSGATSTPSAAPNPTTETGASAKSPAAYPANVGEDGKGDCAKEYESPVPYGQSAPVTPQPSAEEYRVSVLCSSPAAEIAKNSDKRISSIMVFYTDSSFEIFKPEADSNTK